MNAPILAAVAAHVHDGHIQRSLSLLTGLAAGASFIEVAQEHTTGSFSHKIMYTPLIFCLLLALAGIGGALSPWLARCILPAAALLLLLDCMMGFGFHIRGIARKPGGWRRNLIFNIVMGPPVFAPLILAMPALLGLTASILLPEDGAGALPADRLELIRTSLTAATGLFAALNGFEAWYSHYKDRFKSPAQWTPIVLAPLLFLTASWALANPPGGSPALAGLSVVAILAGMVGFGFHLRGIARRPGGRPQTPYKILYGPPLFAPLLFAATGLFGLLGTQIGGLP